MSLGHTASVARTRFSDCSKDLRTGPPSNGYGESKASLAPTRKLTTFHRVSFFHPQSRLFICVFALLGRNQYKKHGAADDSHRLHFLTDPWSHPTLQSEARTASVSTAAKREISSAPAAATVIATNMARAAPIRISVRDKADVLNNLLVTSTKSKTTYWNRNCAICNKENIKDLRLWAVQVVCPSKHGDVTFRKSYVEDHLIFDLDLEEWGLKVKDGFVACTLTFLQPTKTVGKLNYCAPNLISSCPAGFEDSEVVEKCSTYHAERKQKNTDLYFRNVHCALCNGISEDELECVGRNYSPLNNIKGKDVVKVVFDSGVWLDRNETEKYKCSSGNMYDPFQARCRQMPESFLRDLNATLYPVNFAHRIMGDACVFATLLVFIFISKYSFY
ncbi:uncharacterized protein CEXT_416731 [Caerostris extrusa]|uniref:Uncharacterized protein n=1 Tax=Caerostris extrusa TaxID=172846 RepID=A0AAV4V7W9_CAEEX|nr:uncharacterized protein CEXT_416731 [Caerostris extrusa]